MDSQVVGSFWYLPTRTGTINSQMRQGTSRGSDCSAMDATWKGSWQACQKALPIGPEVVSFYGLYLESYKVIPKRNYLGAYG